MPDLLVDPPPPPVTGLVTVGRECVLEQQVDDLPRSTENERSDAETLYRLIEGHADRVVHREGDLHPIIRHVIGAARRTGVWCNQGERPLQDVPLERRVLEEVL
ncbi:MAG TPA: hypothetical protein VGR11_03675 [Solirubrobacteraceae bacterium]|nr:hypothetical protein [Solirubrobacteraceae bacterium]